MAEVVSFKERVARTVVQYSHDYQTVFIENEYLVCSAAFSLNPYYIITANESNYLHLTGITYHDPRDFFTKCLTGSLSETDISFIKRGEPESAVKGSVRRKIAVLPNLTRLFESTFKAEESFSKNRIVCSFGTSDGQCTIGFITVPGEHNRVVPMTLLSGMELDPFKAKDVNLVLHRKRGETEFDSIVIGDTDTLNQYKKPIYDLLSEKMKKLLQVTYRN